MTESTGNVYWDCRQAAWVAWALRPVAVEVPAQTPPPHTALPHDVAVAGVATEGERDVRSG
jgi:hypothetical protein